MIFIVSALPSCSSSRDNPTPTKQSSSDQATITIDLANVRQEMIGFGGALTWYSNWVTGNSKLSEIANEMFSDLGIDIIRFKNWYYPDNYPTDKTTTTMTGDGAKFAWDATNLLYTLAKQRNPNVKILLSSWGPPTALKDNGQLQQGTLKKNSSGVFMYDEFAQYWNDVLDNVPFNPDYISIQNEPTFATSGWTTCQWSSVETTVLPSYIAAFDRVYDKIKTRSFVPVMVGPESQDVSTFNSFASALSSDANCGALAFHPYNINSSSEATTINNSLLTVGGFSAKPNMMTEFSDNLDWYNTALFIQRALLYANSSAYIYWKLAWYTPTTGKDAGMISVASANSTATYTVTPFFYLIKHFAKYVDAGFHRIDAITTNTSLIATAFVNPAASQLTIVVVNDGTQTKVDFAITGKTISTVSAYQSVVGSYYQALNISSPTQAITLPSKSVTTLVLNI